MVQRKVLAGCTMFFVKLAVLSWMLTRKTMVYGKHLVGCTMVFEKTSAAAVT